MEKYETLSFPAIVAFTVFLYGGIAIGALTTSQSASDQGYAEQLVQQENLMIAEMSKTKSK